MGGGTSEAQARMTPEQLRQHETTFLVVAKYVEAKCLVDGKWGQPEWEEAHRQLLEVAGEIRRALDDPGPIAEERMREQLAYAKSRLSEILAQLWSPTKH